MKAKPDNRRDNVEKIQRNIDNTVRNIEMAEDMMNNADNPKARRDLEAKNERREEALDAMREEIRDEALDRERGYDD